MLPINPASRRSRIFPHLDDTHPDQQMHRYYPKKQKRASGKRISFVSARLTENGDYLTYALNVDPSEKEAHEIRVTPGYVPEGYVYQTDGPYESKWYNEKTEEEIAELNREHEEANEEAAASTIVSGDRIRGINDTLSIDGNEDGSLKPHERFTGDNDRMTESTDAAFIIVKTKLRNTGDTAIDTYLSPLLRYLDENGNGDYTLLDPGEEKECISVYVIDKDRLDSAYMEYFDTGAAAADTPELYVKVKE